MNILTTPLPGVLILEPRVFRDDRGYFLETWNQSRYAEAGLPPRFVQDNVSSSGPGVLRGLHYQQPSPQGKLVQALRGEIWDVAVDIRVGSPTFGHYEAVTLSADNGRQFYIPEGYAHGFVVLSDHAIVSYKCTEYYQPRCEASLRWDDPDLNIPWPVDNPVLSPKDREAPRLREVPAERLPRFLSLRAHAS